MTDPTGELPDRAWRDRIHEIVFEADTPAGKAFDVGLLFAILLSIVAISLETVESVDARYHDVLVAVEWALTILFSIEYVLRLVSVRRAWRYAASFYGVVDLLAILPTYLSLLFPGSQSLAVIRAIRLLRVFRVFKLGRFLSEAAVLRHAVWEARTKVIVFFSTVLIAVTIAAAGMYAVESQVEGSHFTSIPQAMYWAIVTMTTVGYGDVVPQTPMGKLLSALLILLGYSLIIVPTGFVSAEFIEARSRGVSTQSCPHCTAEGHAVDARYCNRCGERL